MKILFLDVDGVLNIHDNVAAVHKDKVDLVNVIVEQTGSKIILSSSWKHSKKDVTYLRTLFDILDVTPDIQRDRPTLARRLEICKWNAINSPTKAVAIDDMDLYFTSRDNIKFFRTDPMVGLTKDMAEEIIVYMKD